MEQKKKSWDQFFRDDSSNMLEDALPYLPASLKKTAAIYIKLTELSHIAHEFDNGSMEMLLNAMKMRAPKDTAAQIDQMLQMMQMMKLYQAYQDFIKSNPNLTSSSPKNTNDDMFSKLMPLLMSQGQQNQSAPNSDFMNQLNQILNK